MNKESSRSHSIFQIVSATQTISLMLYNNCEPKAWLAKKFFLNRFKNIFHSQQTIESREHIEGEEIAGSVNVSILNLVDLAGSERSGQTGATGKAFKEGTHINKSLSVLALVIKQLSEDPHKYVQI